MSRVLYWVARLFGVGVFFIDQNVLRAAELASREVESLPGLISGDYRRSVAMGKMVKRRPGTGKREIAMAIEYMIRRGVI